MTCAECGKFNDHFAWCSKAKFADDLSDDQVLALFELWLMDIDSEPMPDMPDADAALAAWGRDS